MPTAEYINRRNPQTPVVVDLLQNMPTSVAYGLKKPQMPDKAVETVLNALIIESTQQPQASIVLFDTIGRGSRFPNNKGIVRLPQYHLDLPLSANQLLALGANLEVFTRKSEDTSVNGVIHNILPIKKFRTDSVRWHEIITKGGVIVAITTGKRYNPTTYKDTRTSAAILQLQGM